jgi:hypothetical protein
VLRVFCVLCGLMQVYQSLCRGPSARDGAKLKERLEADLADLGYADVQARAGG